PGRGRESRGAALCSDAAPPSNLDSSDNLLSDWPPTAASLPAGREGESRRHWREGVMDCLSSPFLLHSTSRFAPRSPPFSKFGKKVATLPLRAFPAACFPRLSRLNSGKIEGSRRASVLACPWPS